MDRELNELYLHEAVEPCPWCTQEHGEKDWHPSKGYRTQCMNCGHSILLCDECLHADDNPTRYCDWDQTTEKCFRDKEGKLQFWCHYQYVEQNWPLAFLSLEIDDVTKLNILSKFDEWYGDTNQELTLWAPEFQLLTRCLISSVHPALLINPHYLELDDVIDEIEDLLRPELFLEYQEARKISLPELRDLYNKSMCGEKLLGAYTKDDAQAALLRLLQERDYHDIVIHQMEMYNDFCKARVSYKWLLNGWEKQVETTVNMALGLEEPSLI